MDEVSGVLLVNNSNDLPICVTYWSYEYFSWCNMFNCV